MRRPLLTTMIALCAGIVCAADPDGIAFFRTKIEPALKSHCFSCHSEDADDVKGGLRLDSRAGVLGGGDSGPAIVAGKSAESLLIQALRHENGLEMPPQKPRLTDATIELFVRWIDMGAPDPREGSGGALADLSEARKHWAFQPVRKPSVPEAEGLRPLGFRAETPIDAFILAKLQEHGWTSSPPATRMDLIRRVTFDLIGLPPTPEEIDEFARDTSINAYEHVVDRLLSSQHYGERWAQHWLDVVRYAETEGYEYDRHVPDAWRFRDYVIDSLNNDKPFDQFLTEQIAGDEIAANDAECLSAAIFHRLGPVRRNAGNPDIALSRNEVLTERTDIIGAAFLGLTIGCARCHNHKLEPISQKDYYRLQAYLAATEEHNITLAGAEEQQAWERATQQIKDEVQRLKKLAKDATGLERERLNEQIEALEDQMPPPLPTIPSTHNDFTKRTAIHVLKRGVWENKGDAVGPRPLSVLVADDVTELSSDVTNPRTQLARWLASPDNPLTARVIVNRLWQQHFGVGLVKTNNDLGVNGERPSHPELLDFLAATLIENGWRLKPIHRLIVLSGTYQQSSATSLATHDSPLTSDPENRLMWRFNRRRLSAEETRDSMLAVSGRLNLRMHGPGVIVPVDAELVSLLYKPSQWAVTADAREHDRRSIYLIAKRNLRLPFFENLDAPALQTSCARRESSTHAPQALELLNGTLSNELAEAFAQRLKQECGDDAARIAERGYRLALGRSPSPQERQLSINFLGDQPVSEFALALFNLNEFLYVP